MSLATRCTHCGTIFKVVQDQLKVSEGWVRCGRCNEVFNALPALFDLDTEAPPPRQVPPAPIQIPQPLSFSDHTPQSSADLAFSAPAQAVASPAMARATTDFELETEVDLSDAGASWSASVKVPFEGPPQSPRDAPSTDEADALESRYLLPSNDTPRLVRRRDSGPEFADARFPRDAWDEIEIELTQHQVAPSAALAEPLSPPPAPASPEAQRTQDFSQDHSGILVNEDYVPEQVVRPPSQRKGRSGTRGRYATPQPPEFVRQAQRQAFWRLPAVRAFMGLLALLLSFGLVAQLGHRFRDQIAAHAPSTRPMLHAWCEQFGCEIRPLRHLESLQVESATLMRTVSEGSDRYRLTVSVRNRSTIALAWPHIDLSLTDDRGDLIARRAFNPHDARVSSGEGMPMLSMPTTVPAGESTQLQWSLRLNNLSPTGYTAELFYP
jgi:predicted Zn finger-like uncharacterized protein